MFCARCSQHAKTDRPDFVSPGGHFLRHPEQHLCHLTAESILEICELSTWRASSLQVPGTFILRHDAALTGSCFRSQIGKCLAPALPLLSPCIILHVKATSMTQSVLNRSLIRYYSAPSFRATEGSRGISCRSHICHCEWRFLDFLRLRSGQAATLPSTSSGQATRNDVPGEPE
jgi:hypothetical protein